MYLTLCSIPGEIRNKATLVATHTRSDFTKLRCKKPDGMVTSEAINQNKVPMNLYYTHTSTPHLTLPYIYHHDYRLTTSVNILVVAINSQRTEGPSQQWSRDR